MVVRYKRETRVKNIKLKLHYMVFWWWWDVVPRVGETLEKFGEFIHRVLQQRSFVLPAEHAFFPFYAHTHNITWLVSPALLN